MYKSVEEIKALIEDSKNRKYMSVSDKHINALVTANNDENVQKKRLENLKKTMKSDSFKKAAALAGAARSCDPKWQKEHKQRMRKLNNVPVITPYGEFECKKDFNEATGFLFSEKTKSMPHLYYEKEKGPGEPTYETVFNCPYGKFGQRRKKEMFVAAEEQGNTEITNLKCKHTWYNKMKKLYPNDFYETTEVKREWDLE